MIWKTNTHLFSATVCQHTGKTCPAVQRMAEKLSQAMVASKPMTSDDFEIEGNSVLKHCPMECPARFTASHDRIRIFCGVTPEAETEDLNRFADALFDPQPRPMPAGTFERPCALAEAVPTNIETQTVHHAVL
ncbi:hypothetical protein TRL7639_00269 [Falsiruegeria litorea R37]|uniref:Uncharacterized protein n=1 Tax=Falsiruegeria litorea R37 TaxID=1200284 RepID=A0A1Y5REZ6_9RHOB|nr:hypothetical protein [Falsiruegeria litorea]SLN15694.1 hypothetical protein TRL7639_00269 [Falsiruegeria litorea R37]